MKFLIIQLYQTGDVALTTHIPRELKSHIKDCHVDFLTLKGNSPIVANNPHIENVLTTTRSSSPLELLKIIRAVRRGKYDAVLDFHDNPRSSYITRLSGAKYRVCYSTTQRTVMYNTLPERLKGTATEIKLSLLRPFIPDFDHASFNTLPEIFVSEESTIKAENTLKNMGISTRDFIVTMSPTQKKATRRWKMKHFIDTAKYLVSEYGAKVIMTYGPGELEYITENMPEMPDGVYLMPPMGLADFCAVIGRAKLHIGNDSAPHHIATALGVPTFIIIGSTTSGWVHNSPEHTFAAKGLECQPCKKSVCRISPEIPCMEGLSLSDIKGQLNEFINQHVKH